jgi:hypothetical protein
MGLRHFFLSKKHPRIVEDTPVVEPVVQQPAENKENAVPSVSVAVGKESSVSSGSVAVEKENAADDRRWVCLYLREFPDQNRKAWSPKAVYKDGLHNWQVEDWLFYREKYFCFRYGVAMEGKGLQVPSNLFPDGIGADKIVPMAHFFDYIFSQKYHVDLKTPVHPTAIQKSFSASEGN